MQLLSINTGQKQPILNAKKTGATGIYKTPVQGPVEISTAGLPGDAICDVENHGGADQAVYVYTTPDYAWWSAELGTELAPGTFGENLTIDEIESAHLCIGDCLHIGAVTLQVTAPRVPCVTLATRMDDPFFVKRFRAAERPGVYCRVLQAGAIQAGATVILAPYAGATVTVLEMFRDFYTPDLTAATIRRYLAAPLAIRARTSKEEQARKLQIG